MGTVTRQPKIRSKFTLFIDLRSPQRQGLPKFETEFPRRIQTTIIQQFDSLRLAQSRSDSQTRSDSLRMAQHVYYHVQLSRSAATAKMVFPGKDPRLKQQKLDLEQPCGGQYITMGVSAGYCSGIQEDIKCPNKRIFFFLQMTNGNGYKAGLAGIVEVDRDRIRHDYDLEIIGDETEITYDRDYYNQILQDKRGIEYRIPIIPVLGSRVNFDNIVPYNKTKPLGWNPGARDILLRMKKVPNYEQMVELRNLLQ